MTRILILSINYWPEEAGIGAFTTHRAEYLARAGRRASFLDVNRIHALGWKVKTSLREGIWLNYESFRAQFGTAGQ